MKLVLLLLVTLLGCSNPPVFEPGPGWTKTAVTNGWAYRSAQGSVLTVLTFTDELMDEKVLFSAQTRRNIRANYEETYRVEEDHVYFSRLPVAGREALVVFFADRSGGTIVHRRQYYWVEGHRVQLITGTINAEFSSAQLDLFVSKALAPIPVSVMLKG